MHCHGDGVKPYSRHSKEGLLVLLRQDVDIGKKHSYRFYWQCNLSCLCTLLVMKQFKIVSPKWIKTGGLGTNRIKSAWTFMTVSFTAHYNNNSRWGNNIAKKALSTYQDSIRNCTRPLITALSFALGKPVRLHKEVKGFWCLNLRDMENYVEEALW